MELLTGIVIGALMGWSAASLMRVDLSSGSYLRCLLGVAGAALGGTALCLLLPGSWSQVQDEFLVWCVAGAAGVIGLATVANVLGLALDLETS